MNRQPLIFAIVLGVVLVVITFGVGIYLALQNNQTPPDSTQPTQQTQQNQQNNNSTGTNSTQNTNPTPTQTTGTTSQSSISISAQDGSQVAANDFLHLSSTKPDPHNPGHYFLAGGDIPTETSVSYDILYVSGDQSFTIGLNREPIKDARTQAEQMLAQELGLSHADMCKLKYWVGVPNSVSPVYSGKNLGFSFCPGAVQLP